MNDITNAQRALWTFLLCALVAPLVAGVMALAAGLAAPIAGAAIPQLAKVPPGAIAVATFVWSAIPAGLAGAAMAVLVYRNGKLDLFAAPAAGVLAFGLAFVLAPFPHGGLLPFLAFVAGLIAFAIRAVLMRAGIVGV